MKMNEHALRLLRDLADAPGASGFEDEVVKAARPYAAAIGEVKEDFLRNLYIYRKENTGNKPVLLLDDVLSELDPKRQDFVLNQIKTGQVFITCCEKERFTKLGQTIEIRKGKIVE